MNDTKKLVLSIFGEPLQAFNSTRSEKTTEGECVRVWLSMTANVRLTAKVRTKLVTKLSTKLIEHWTRRGGYKNLDLEDKKTQKMLRSNVNRIVNEAERIKNNCVKYLDNEQWITKKRKLFQSPITIDLNSKATNSKVPEVIHL